MTVRQVRFFFVDVFAARPLTGNPLALVPDADGLEESAMKALAREFHQSETTFVLRPTRDDARWRLRSFTPAGFEVGGAGHNALGAWLWLADAGRVGDGDHVQQIGDELLPVTVSRRPDGIHVAMTQGSPRVSEPVADAPAVAEALGIGASAIDAELAVRVGSTGVPHLLVPVHGAEVVDAVRPDARALLSVLRAAGAEGCYVYSIDSRGDAGEGTDADAYARFFNPTVGIVEDPATGTAAGPLAAHLVRAGRLPDGADVRIDQGHALGRPSRLVVNVAGDAVILRGSGVVSGEGLMRL